MRQLMVPPGSLPSSEKGQVVKVVAIRRTTEAAETIDPPRRRRADQGTKVAEAAFLGSAASRRSAANARED
jgi:hypothetical protein